MNLPSWRSILILEDEPLIALDLESTLADAGFDDVVIFTACKDAAAWLSAASPLVAILDIRLKDGICDEVARTLVTRQIPFLVCSASHADDIKEIFLSGIRLAKPCAPHLLVSAVRQPSMFSR